MGALADPQAVQSNNPYKLVNRRNHVFFILHLWMSTYQRGAQTARTTKYYSTRCAAPKADEAQASAAFFANASSFIDINLLCGIISGACLAD
jgi:hypothetical protein